MAGSQQEAGAGRSKAESESRELVFCCLSLFVLSLALLWPVFQHPRRWIWTPGAEHSDLAVTHWPNADFTRRTLWEHGRFPLWRPTIMSGAPFAANPLAGLYYPPNWLFLFLPWLPLELGFNLSVLVHLWLAGAAMYAFMRRGVGTGMWGALVAAVAYEASPKLLAHLGAGHVGWIQAWGWLPVVVLCWLEALQRARAGAGKQGMGNGKKRTVHSSQFAVLGGVALAIQFCADVRMAAYTLVAAGTSVLVFAIRHSVRPLRPQFVIRNLFPVVCAPVIFLGLTACQWLPTAILLPETTRASMTLSDAAVWSLPWRYLAGLFLADHGGFHEWMTYVGVSTLVLAGGGVGALWRRREERWCAEWLVGLLVGAAWFSLGENGGLFQVLWRIVPGLGLLRVPPRAWVLVVFAVAALAGLGVQGAGRPKRWKQALLLAVGTFPPLLVAGYWLLVGTPPLSLVVFGVVTPLAVAWEGFRSRVPRSRVRSGLKPGTLKPETAFGLAAVLLVAIDLLAVDATLVEARSSEAVFADGRAAAEWLAVQADHFRVYSPSYSIPQHVAELYGLKLADGVDPLQLRVYADYLTRAAGLESDRYSVTLPPFPVGADVQTALRDAVPDAEMLGLLGVRYLAAAFPVADADWQSVGQFEEVYIYENRQARPLPEVDGVGDILLADGTMLFRYRSWSVYAGWGVSGVTVAGLLVSSLVGRLRGRRTDG